MSSTKPTILVTGATGTTGGLIASQLLATGKVNVRVMVRDTSKVSKLQAQGAQVVKQPDSPSDMVAAFKQVTGMYMMMPLLSADDEAKLFKSYMDAMKANGTKQVVYISVVGVTPYSPLYNGRRHYAREQAMKQSGLQYTFLHPAFFHDNYQKFQLDSIKSSDQYVGAGGNGKFASIDARDIAAVAVAALLEPAKHDKQTYNLATGPPRTEDETAAMISKVAGRTIKFVNMETDAHAEMLKKYGLPEEAAHDFSGVEMMKRDSLLADVYPDVKQVLGRGPISFSQYLQDNKDMFAK